MLAIVSKSTITLIKKKLFGSTSLFLIVNLLIWLNMASKLVLFVVDFESSTSVQLVPIKVLLQRVCPQV